MSDIDGEAISAWLKRHQDLDIAPERAREIAGRSPSGSTA